MTECKKCGECCGKYHVTLHPDEAPRFTHKKLENLYEKGRKLGLVWALQRDKNGNCVYLENKLCTIHEIKPSSCKEYSCQMK